jgi:Domain of unknown function (DUF4337)
MEEQEVPLEDVHEHIAHEAHVSQDKWVSRVALSTAILAALAAISALLAGDHANEAMIDQIEASDQWNFYQAKGIKAEVLKMRLEMAGAQSAAGAGAKQAKLVEYTNQQAEIRKQAEEQQGRAREHLHKHVILARGVTLFQIAIAIAAISILTKRRLFWGVSLLFGAIGVTFLAWALLAVRGV